MCFIWSLVYIVFWVEIITRVLQTLTGTLCIKCRRFVSFSQSAGRPAMRPGSNTRCANTVGSPRCVHTSFSHSCRSCCSCRQTSAAACLHSQHKDLALMLRMGISCCSVRREPAESEQNERSAHLHIHMGFTLLL